jgi:hypothetical protein
MTPLPPLTTTTITTTNLILISLFLFTTFPSLLFSHQQSIIISVTLAQDTKKYSYICLEAQQELCLGISPGDGEPSFDPNNVFWLQVKSRTKNEYQLTDYKKTRWDFDFDTGGIILSRFSDLCIARDTGNKVGLFPCETVGLTNPNYSPDTRYGRWNLQQFQMNENQAGSLELFNSDRSSCLTVMKCSGGKGWCDPNSNDPAIDPVTGKFIGLSVGSYLKMKPCWDAPGGFPGLQALQIWRQRLDCAAGCSPALEFNDVCDPPCNVAQCSDYDSGNCKTQSPTPPTKSPTPKTGPKPTSPPPTDSPTTRSPNSKPTFKPSSSPTKLPTTANPTHKPTHQPTGSPGVICPPMGVLDKCAANVERSCTKNKLVAAQCVWCFDKCLPRSDPRVCQIDGLYDSCEAQCPTDLQRIRCPSAKTPVACMRATPWRMANCQWCLTTGICIPGKNPGACTNPNFYSHCGTVAPTQALCPSPRIFDKCTTIIDSKKCMAASWCSWCPGTNDCRPTKDVGICDGPFIQLRSIFFKHCPLLQPRTLSPRGGTGAPHIGTRAPHIGTAAPHIGTAAPHVGTAAPHVGTAAPHSKTPTNAGTTNCPSQYWFNKCVNIKSQGRCDPAFCTWCGGTGYICRPGTNKAVCDAPAQTLPILRSGFFANCPNLQLTSTPAGSD